MFAHYRSKDNWLVTCLAGAALAASAFFFHMDGSIAENLGLATTVAAYEAPAFAPRSERSEPEVRGVYTHESSRLAMADTEVDTMSLDDERVKEAAEKMSQYGYNKEDEVNFNVRKQTTDVLNVRNVPSGIKQGSQPIGATGSADLMRQVISGGYTWVYVDFDEGHDGFVALSYLVAEVLEDGERSQAQLEAQIKMLGEMLIKLQALYAEQFGTDA